MPHLPSSPISFSFAILNRLLPGSCSRPPLDAAGFRLRGEQIHVLCRWLADWTTAPFFVRCSPNLRLKSSGNEKLCTGRIKELVTF